MKKEKSKSIVGAKTERLAEAQICFTGKNGRAKIANNAQQSESSRSKKENTMGFGLYKGRHRRVGESNSMVPGKPSQN